MMVREALNSALDEEMAADPRVFLMGEEVRQKECVYDLAVGCFLLRLMNYLFDDSDWGISRCLQG